MVKVDGASEIQMNNSVDHVPHICMHTHIHACILALREQSSPTCILGVVSVNRKALMKSICRQTSGANVLVCEGGREAWLNVALPSLSQRPHSAFSEPSQSPLISDPINKMYSDSIKQPGCCAGGQ